MIGSVLAERYELKEELSRGGMALVFRASDLRLNREVAVKLMARSELDPIAIERFEREAQLIAALDHSAIVPIFDYGQHQRGTGGWLYIVMPLLRGSTLLTLMREKRLSEPEFREVFLQVAEAIEHGASRAIVHRDIKPENIMVARDGDRLRAWVMDYGLAIARSDNRLTRTDNLPGTLGYLSPEQILTGEVDVRTDLYALGVIAYEYFSGRPPFSGAPATVLYKIVHEKPAPLVDLKGHWSEIIGKCLAKDPNQRFASGRELTRMIQGIGAPAELEPVAPSPQSPRWAIPLFGRDFEVAEVERRLDAAAAGELQLLMIDGAAGIGRTRLIDEIDARARASGYLLLRSTFVEREGALPYAVFADLLLDYFSQRRTSSVEHSSLPVEQLAELLELFPQLAALPGVAVAPRTSGERSGELAHIYELIGSSLAALTGRQPLALLVEEWHLASLSLPLLLYLFRRLGPTPTLLVASFRTGEVSKRHPLNRLLRSLEGDRRFMRLTLAELNPTSHGHLVEALIARGKVEPATCAEVFAATDGHPLLTVELVQALLAAGELSLPSQGALVGLVGSLRIGRLPLGVLRSLDERLERLVPGMRALVDLAAVIGRRFVLRELEMFAQAEGLTGFDETLDFLLSENWLNEERSTRGERLRFSNFLIRDLVYEQLGPERRRELHGRFAAALERRFFGRQDRIYPRLLEHFVKAQDPLKAAEFALLTASQHFDAGNFAEVVACAAPTFELCAPSAMGKLRFLVAKAEQGRGDSSAAEAAAMFAFRDFELVADRTGAAEAALFLAETAWQDRKVDRCWDWLEKGLAWARQAVGFDTLRRLLDLRATAASLRGDAVLAASALAEIDQLDHPPEILAGGALAELPPLRIGLLSSITTQEPALSATSEDVEVLGCVFETLLDVDADGRLSPGLARLVQSSPLGAELEIRQSARFSDGTAINATVVKRELERTAREFPDQVGALLRPLAGCSAFLAGAATTIVGLKALDETRLIFELETAMAFFPSLLADRATAVSKVISAAENSGVAGSRLVGSGPWCFGPPSREALVLVRNPWWAGAGVHLSRLEFRVFRRPEDLEDAFARHELELVRDLRPSSLERWQRQASRNVEIHEALLPSTCFVCFNPRGPATSDPRLRRILAGVLDPRELLHRTVASWVKPAFGWLPTNLDASMPAWRPQLLERVAAINAIEDFRPLVLRVLVHPRFGETLKPLTQELLGEWSMLGIDLRLEEPDLGGFLERLGTASDVDVVLARFIPDYPDPDAMVFPPFDSAVGLYRQVLALPELDELSARARGEQDAVERRVLYRRIEELLLGRDLIVPLCREVRFRLTSGSVRGLGQRSATAVIDYRQAVVVPPDETTTGHRRGRLRASIRGQVESFDPLGALVRDVAEVTSNVFETLTRVTENGVIEPHLLAEWQLFDGDTRFRGRLRDIRFHDGRPLTARDVRFTIFRGLRRPAETLRTFDAPLVGARELIEGAQEIEGFTILNESTFEIKLERPQPLLPALFSHPVTAIVPEGIRHFSGSWRDGCVGTGPFRLVAIESTRRVELAANPRYWRAGLPRAERLVFELNQKPSEALERWRRNELDLITQVDPLDFESLLREPFSELRQHSGLSIYFAAFNQRRGPLKDPKVRAALVATLRWRARQAEALLGRVGARATSLIPPDLLGQPRANAALEPLSDQKFPNRPLFVVVHPQYQAGSPFAAWADRLLDGLAGEGFHFEVLTPHAREWLKTVTGGAADLVLARWSAAYPDAEAFLRLLHRDGGLLHQIVGAPELDALIDRIRLERDPSKRRHLLLELEDHLEREHLLLPFFHERQCAATRVGAVGLRLRYAFPHIAWEELWVES